MIIYFDFFLVGDYLLIFNVIVDVVFVVDFFNEVLLYDYISEKWFVKLVVWVLNLVFKKFWVVVIIYSDYVIIFIKFVDY